MCLCLYLWFRQLLALLAFCWATGGIKGKDDVGNGKGGYYDGKGKGGNAKGKDDDGGNEMTKKADAIAH
jgi:hypothetical protein